MILWEMFMLGQVSRLWRSWMMPGVLLFLASVCCVPVAFANDIQLANIILTGQVTASDTYDIQLDVAWSNSWYISGAPSLTANWDAAWIFAKYSVYSGGVWGEWKHCKLSTSDADHTAPTGSQIDTGITNISGTDYGMGVFLYRNAAGTGAVDFNGVKMKWNYGADSVADSAVLKVQVFALEMVYIPTGSFSAGGTMPVAQKDFRQGSADTDPWAVTSENAISVTNAVSNGYYYLTDSCANDDADGAVFTIPAEFPKGYNKFYLMKYELSQGMYRDFLNSLTRTQQANHIEAVIASGDISVTNRFVMSNSTTVTVRNSIRAPASFTANVPITFGCDLNADGTFNGSTDGEWIAVNYLKWTDVAAFADWAGLRPFTEMEFEKAARGGQAVVMYEYAWGNTTYETATTSLSNTGAYNEVPNQGNSNQASSTPDGPYRVGSFSDAGATRQNAGAGYYGNLDLSGNLVENIVTVGVSASRSFDGTKQGDGSLSTNGYADVTTWPGLSSGEVTLESGYGDKGVSYGSSIAYQRTSQREYAACTMAARNAGVGLRVARNAP